MKKTNIKGGDKKMALKGNYDKMKSRKFYIVKTLGVNMTVFVVLASFVICFIGMFLKNPAENVINTWKTVAIAYFTIITVHIIGYFFYNVKQKIAVDKDAINSLLKK